MGIGLKPDDFDEAQSSGDEFLEVEFGVDSIQSIVVLVVGGNTGEMDDVQVLLSADVEEPVLDGDLGDVFKTVQMVPLDPVGFDTGRREDFDRVLFDLAAFTHEQQFLFGVVVESGVGIDFNVGLVDKSALVVELDHVQPVHQIQDENGVRHHLDHSDVDVTRQKVLLFHKITAVVQSDYLFTVCSPPPHVGVFLVCAHDWAD